jgi:DNA-binding transcriptional MerR regulator/methylmalonyl-CoA mutase cobalamin-binding subunit
MSRSAGEIAAMINMQGLPETTPRHPIGVVAQRTGLSIHVLRAWERRYGVVRPTRTRGRQRLYTDADVLRLRLLRQVTESGRSIGRVSRLTTEELLSLVAEDGAGGAGDDGDGSRRGLPAYQSEMLRRCLEAAERLEGDTVHGVLMHALVRLSPAAFVGTVVGPLLERVGELWHEGRWLPAHEHLVTVQVRRVLTWLLGAFDAPVEAPLLVATTAEGELHELGAMLASAVAAEEGWRVTYLGPSLPAADIADVAAQKEAQAVALSIVHAEAVDAAARLIGELGARLGRGTVLLVGGRSAERVRRSVEAVGGAVIRDLDHLRTVVRALNPARWDAAHARDRAWAGRAAGSAGNGGR